MVRFSVASGKPSAPSTSSTTADFLRKSATSGVPNLITSGGGGGGGGGNRPTSFEESLERRPFQEVGKSSFSLYGRPATAMEPQASLVPMPEVPQSEIKPQAPGLGDYFDMFRRVVMPWVVPGSGQLMAFGEMRNAWDEAQQSDDVLLRDTARQWRAKAENNEISAYDAMRQFYDQYLTIEAKRKGQSAEMMKTLAPQPMAIGNPGQMLGQGAAQALLPLTILQSMTVRQFGSKGWLGGEDRVKSTLTQYDQPDHGKLTPGLVSLTEAYKSGALNEDEFRDNIQLEGFGLTDPEPLGDGNALPNMAYSLLMEVFSDPLIVPTVLSLGGTKIVGMAGSRVIPSVIRTVGEEAVAAEARRLGVDVAEYAASAAGKNLAAAERAAFSNLVEETGSRIKNVPSGSLKTMDRLEAIARVADENPALFSVIQKGWQEGGVAGTVALRAPKIIRAAEAIDKATDVFTFMGKTAGAVRARMVMSNLFAEGFYDAFGWQAVRKTDALLREAGVSDEMITTLQGRAAANHSLQIGNNTILRRMRTTGEASLGAKPTELAQAAVEMAGGDVRRLMRDQVDRTSEFIVAARAGGVGEATDVWRERVAKMLVDWGNGDVTDGAARAAAAKMNERQMRLILHMNWAHMIGALDSARNASVGLATPEFSADYIARATMLGPRQMDEKARQALLEAVASDDVGTIRRAISQYDDLTPNVSLSLDDADLMPLVKQILDALEGRLPVALTDIEKLPAPLAEFVRQYGDAGYQLALRPADDELSQVIRNEAGDIIAVRSWIDAVTDKTKIDRVGKINAAYNDVFRGISGGEIERNAQRRFVQYMADTVGMAEADSREIMRSVKRIAEVKGTTPRGLRTNDLVRAVEEAHISKRSKTQGTRAILDGIMSSYENELRLVGLSQKFTGRAKTILAPAWDNMIGSLSEDMYPRIRFTQNPFFIAQELVEYPYFMILRGKYPMKATLANVPVVGRPVRGRALMPSLAAEKQAKHVFDEKTRFLMEYFADSSWVASDMIEASDIVRRGFRVADRIANRKTRLGKRSAAAVEAFDNATNLSGKKGPAEAVIYRERLGDELRKMMMEESPATWNAVRAGMPQHYTDGQVAAEWLFDLIARSDPDSVWSRVSPSMFKPEHLGRRSRISGNLIGKLVAGDEGMTIPKLRRKIASSKDPLTSDYVSDVLRQHGADEDYIARVESALTFPEPDEFYGRMAEFGVSEAQAKAMREADTLAAGRHGVGLHEYLSQRWVDAPQSVDQFGNQHGIFAFQAIVDSLETRGLIAPERGAAMLDDLRQIGVGLGVDWPKYLPVPEGTLVKDLPKAVRDARQKVNQWTNARAKRALTPEEGSPVLTPEGKNVLQTAKHTVGRPTYDEWVRQLEEIFPSKAAREEYADWYTDMQRGFLALFSDTPDTQVEDAARMIVAFGVTQLNTSPALGMEFLYRVMSMARRGEDWPSALGLTAGEAKRVRQASGGLNFSQLQSLLMERGGTVPENLGQKLSDFIDSLVGSKRRSVGIDGPDLAHPWQPVAGDVWAKRDLGFLDPKVGKQVWRVYDDGVSSRVLGVQATDAKTGKPLFDDEGDEVWVKGSISGIEVTMKDGSKEIIGKEYISDSVPTNLEYDYIVEYYNGLARYLNDRNYLNREWTAADAQAMGWFRAKTAFGDSTGDVRSAMFKGRWGLGSEINPKPGTRIPDLLNGVDLSPESSDLLQNQLLNLVHRQALEDAGVMTPRSGIRQTPGYALRADGTAQRTSLIEVLGDRSAAAQYAARLGYYGKMDEVLLIRDTNIKVLDYAGAKNKGNIGAIVRVSVESAEEGRRLIDGLSARQTPFPKGAHLAQADDGSWMVQALWDPAGGPAGKKSFDKAVPAEAVDEAVSEILGRQVTSERGPVEFIRVTNDWSAKPDGADYLASITAPSHRVHRWGRDATPSPTAGQLEQQRVDELALRAEDIVQGTIAREAALARTSGIYASLPTDSGTGHVVGPDDLLARTEFQRAPVGTRAAIVRSASPDRRSQLFFGGQRVTPDSLLHELAHDFAFDLDPSAIRRVKAIKSGVEGTKESRGRHYYRMTTDDQEWFVDQFLLWSKDPESVHATLRPLMEAFRREVKAKGPSPEMGTLSLRPLIKAVDDARSALDAAVAAGEGRKVTAPLRRTLADARKALKEAEAQGGVLSPEMKAFFEEQAEAAKARQQPTFWDNDENLMFQWAERAHSRSTRAAKDLVQFRQDRSLLERSMNHPFFGFYPLSYMYGKVLPNLIEFLMFRPFGFKAPGIGYSVTNRMYQSFMRQQEHDDSLREYMWENEPAIRALSMFVPGVPWDLPVNAPLWQRRIAEAIMTNARLIEEGEEPKKIDVLGILGDVVGYQFGLSQTFDTFGRTAEAAAALPGIVERATGGKPPAPSGEGQDLGGPFVEEPVPAPTPQSSTWEPVVNVGPAAVPAAMIEQQVSEQMDLLSQELGESVP